MTKLLLLFGLLLICCSLVNTTRQNGVSINLDELAVTVYEGKITLNNNDEYPSSHFYVKVTVGNQRQRTRIVKNSEDKLQWNEKMYFNVNPHDETLLFELMENRAIMPNHCHSRRKIRIDQINDANFWKDALMFTDKNNNPRAQIRFAFERNAIKQGHGSDHDVIDGHANQVSKDHSQSCDGCDDIKITPHEVHDQFDAHLQHDEGVKGNLVVSVFDAQVICSDGDLFTKPDYYVKVTVGSNSRFTKAHHNDSKKTKVDKNSGHEPHWNEKLYLDVGPDDHEVLVELMDHDTLTRDDHLGYVRINIDNVHDSNDGTVALKDNKDRPIGEIHLNIARRGHEVDMHRSNIGRDDCIRDEDDCSRSNLGRDDDDCSRSNNGRDDCSRDEDDCSRSRIGHDEIGCDNDRYYDCIDGRHEKDHKGNLVISVLDAVVFNKKGDVITRPDYFVKVTVGDHSRDTRFHSNQSDTTRVDKNSGHAPQWNQKLDFNVGPNDCDLLVELMDEDTFTRDDHLGFVKINLKDIRHVREQFYHLRDKDGRAICDLRLNIERMLDYNHYSRSSIEHDAIGKDSYRNDEHHDGHRQHEADTKGDLVVLVKDAEIYNNKGDWLTKPDYFVKVTVGEHTTGHKHLGFKFNPSKHHDSKSEKTKVCKNSNAHPTWDETIRLNVGPEDREVLFELMDHDTFTKDDHLGFFVMTFEEIEHLHEPNCYRAFVNKHGNSIGRLRLELKWRDRLDGKANEGHQGEGRAHDECDRDRDDCDNDDQQPEARHHKDCDQLSDDCDRDLRHKKHGDLNDHGY